MFSAISTYLFGDDAIEVQLTDDAVCQTEDTVNDWIFVDHVSFQGETIAGDEPQMKPNGNGGVGMEESWFVTPPPCFACKPKGSLNGSQVSKLENLLIEHPSMSVYGPRSEKVDRDGASPEQSADNTVALRSSGQARRGGQAKIFLCKSHEKRLPLKDLGCNYAVSNGHNLSRRSSKRSNQNHHRNLNGQHHKKLDRKAGKHVGMVGKRAK